MSILQGSVRCLPDETVLDPRRKGLDDHALMALTACGDRSAYAELTGRYLKIMVAVAGRILGNAAEADEVVQEAFLRLWIYAPRWDPEGTGTVRTWLSRVVTNLCLDRCRARRTVPLEDVGDIEDDKQSVHDSMQDEDRRRLVQGLLNALPENQRCAVVLAYFEEMSGKDVAVSMNLTVGAVESLLVRARRALRVAVQEAGLVWGEDV